MGLGIIFWKATIQEMKTLRFYKDIVCEAFVTFLFMTAITQSSMNFNYGPAMATYVKSTVGMFAMALIESFGHVNYALFNPNLVIAFAITKRLSIIKGILLIIIEILAGSGAAFMVYRFTPQNVTEQLTPPVALEGISTESNWACEFIANIFFVGVLIGALDEGRKPVNIPHLAVGFAVLSATVVGGPFGVCLNPVVSFGLSAVTGSWNKVWIYWTAGPVGAMVGVLAYHFFAYDVGTCGKTSIHDPEDMTGVNSGSINKGFVDDSTVSVIGSSQFQLGSKFSDTDLHKRETQKKELYF